jgi:hypothetical protein
LIADAENLIFGGIGAGARVERRNSERRDPISRRATPSFPFSLTSSANLDLWRQRLRAFGE